MAITRKTIAWANIAADKSVVSSMGLVGSPVDVSTVRTFSIVADDFCTTDRVQLLWTGFDTGTPPFDAIALHTHASGTWTVVDGVACTAIVGAFSFEVVRYTQES